MRKSRRYPRGLSFARMAGWNTCTMRYVRHILVSLLIASAIFASATAAVGANRAGRAVPTVSVRLSEFKVVLSRRTIKSGKVTFVVKNVGKLMHNLVVLKTNLPPGGLPTVGTKAREVGRVGMVPTFKPGQTKTLTLKLRAGKY